MAEEKDADELAQEEAQGYEMPPLPPIPLQLLTSDGKSRPTQREPGAWCDENNVTPPPGSFESQGTAIGSAPPDSASTPEPTPEAQQPRSPGSDGQRPAADQQQPPADGQQPPADGHRPAADGHAQPERAERPVALTPEGGP
jgi:hypothetical protein